jgi:hypothetical protein
MATIGRKRKGEKKRKRKEKVTATKFGEFK